MVVNDRPYGWGGRSGTGDTHLVLVKSNTHPHVNFIIIVEILRREFLKALCPRKRNNRSQRRKRVGGVKKLKILLQSKKTKKYWN